jgi:phosphoglycolate phosphatase-like HAD superfamily hydrolase
MGLAIQPMRLVLFDIDGTLLSTGGVATEVFTRVLSELAGRDITLDGYSLAGKTDPRIVRDLLAQAGHGPAHIDALVPRILEGYLDRFPAALAASPKPRLLPGVRELLVRLAALPEVLLGLLTGNIERGAAIKLDHFGLLELFRLGAYGSDSEDRRALVAVAAGRAERLTGVRFPPPAIVVVGDTPLDIDCGRAAGAVTVAVATGPYGTAELAAHGPDAVFADLRDRDRVIAAVLGLRPAAGRAAATSETADEHK